MPTDCIFCKIVKGAIPAARFYENEFCLCFPDLNPQAPTHLLLVPRQHIASLAQTTAEHRPLFGQLLSAAAEVARLAELGNGYRVVINTGDDGGQTVNHLHLHILGGRPMSWPPG